MNGELVTVRLEVEGMRHTVIQALALHEASLAKEVRKAVEAAVAKFDPMESVFRMVDDVLTRTIRDAVEMAVRDKLATAIQAAVAVAMRRQP